MTSNVINFPLSLLNLVCSLIFIWIFTILHTQRIRIFQQIRTICTSNVHKFSLSFHGFVHSMNSNFKQIHTIYISNVHTFPLNFHYFILSTKSNFLTSLDYLYILCTPSWFGTFIDFPLIFPEFLHSTNSNFLTNSNYSRHLPLCDLYESFIFLSWSFSIIHMVTYLNKHKNHLSAITMPMLKIVYAENRNIFMRKQWIVLINTKNRFYECYKQIWIYSKHDVQRGNFINVETDLSMQKNRFDYCEI